MKPEHFFGLISVWVTGNNFTASVFGQKSLCSKNYISFYIMKSNLITPLFFRNFYGTELKTLRVHVNSMLKNIILIVKTINQFDNSVQ